MLAFKDCGFAGGSYFALCFGFTALCDLLSVLVACDLI